MAVNDPRGFELAKSLHGTHTGITQRYRVSADNAASIFPGDLVMLTTQGGVTGWTDASAVGAADPVLGVVKCILNSNGRPLTFTQPTRGPYLEASTEGYVEVYTDPDAVFVANCSSTVAQSTIGVFAGLAAGTPSSAAGRSGQGVNIAEVTASSIGDTPLRVIGIAEFDGFPDNITSGATANNDVYVQIADHAFRRASQRVGHGS